MSVDTVALDTFLSETAFVYAFEIGGAVLALSIVILFLLSFRNLFLGKLYNYA